MKPTIPIGYEQRELGSDRAPNRRDFRHALTALGHAVAEAVSINPVSLPVSPWVDTALVGELLPLQPPQHPSQFYDWASDPTGL